MESVGQKLRGARLGLGLSLEDVSARTRINVRGLSAIETDDFEGISSRFLYKSFVRQVAEVVELGADTLGGELEAAVSHIPEPLVPGQPGAPVRPKLPSLRSSRVRLSRWVSSFALLLVMLAACSSLYSLWQRSRGGVLRASLSILSAPIHREPQAARRPGKTEAASGLAPAPATPATGVVAPVRVEVSALERTWLSVVADGKEVYTGILQASERKTLEGYEMARLRTGNAGGVEIIFNGKKLGALGSRGQVETVEFQKDGYRIVGASDSHLALASLSLTSGQSFGQ